jgi:uncharacterized small protein (DUF1192 family)
MFKNPQIKVTPAGVVLLIAVTYLGTRVSNQEEIARAKVEAEQLEAERDSIRGVVEATTAVQNQLRRERGDVESDVETLRRTVARLEQQRREQQFTVRRIRKTSELQQRLEQTFPEMAASAWGLISVPYSAVDTLGIEYLMIPAWFSETFIIDHQNAQSWRNQKDKLLSVDSLQLMVTALQDSIMRLEVGKSQILQAGYSNAFGAYQGLSDRYIAELRKPRVSLGTTVGVCLGAAGVGLVIGALVGG